MSRDETYPIELTPAIEKAIEKEIQRASEFIRESVQLTLRNNREGKRIKTEKEILTLISEGWFMDYE